MLTEALADDSDRDLDEAAAEIVGGFRYRKQLVPGLGVMARAIGLDGHILEESEQPLPIELWQRADDEASVHPPAGAGVAADPNTLRF